MKKILLSAFIVLTFTAYAINKRIEATNEITVVTPIASPAPIKNFITPSPKRPYADGSFTGDVTDAYYGNVQVKVTIQSGKIIDVQFLDYPQDRRTSMTINSQAMPYLKTETIQAQNASVDIVSGATATSRAFIQSLQSALNKAKS